MMWKKCLLPLGIVLVVHLAPLHAGPVDDGNPSFQGIGKPDTTQDNGDVRRRRAAVEPTTMLVQDVGSEVEETGKNPSTSTHGSGILTRVAQVPLNIFWRIAAVPLNIVGNVISWGMGIAWNVTEVAMIRAWEFTRDSVIPRLDKISLKIVASESAPQELKSMFMSLHSGYAFLKLFGYMKAT